MSTTTEMAAKLSAPGPTPNILSGLVNELRYPTVPHTRIDPAHILDCPSRPALLAKTNRVNSAVALPLAPLASSKPVPINRPRPVSPEAVRSQLARILQSDGFIHANRMKRFLEYIVEETLAGRARHLCEYAIGVSVFGRTETFEPGLDPIVRNDARRLRQKLLEYHQRVPAGELDQLVIDVPKGGYIPVFKTAASSPSPKLNGKYRLVVKLLRCHDGAEVWGTEQEVSLQ